jgi:hypothetical protein
MYLFGLFWKLYRKFVAPSPSVVGFSDLVETPRLDEVYIPHIVVGRHGFLGRLGPARDVLLA